MTPNVGVWKAMVNARLSALIDFGKSCEAVTREAFALISEILDSEPQTLFLIWTSQDGA